MQARTLHDVIGYSGRLSYLFGRICGAVPGLGYARHLLMAVPAENIPSMPKGYAARVLSALDLTDQEIDASPQIQAARLAAGMVCIGAFDSKDRLVGVTWLVKGSHDEDVLEVRFRLPRHAAWDGGLWVDEERRLSRAFVAIWAGVGEWLAREGLRETLSSVADYNAASIAAHRRLGAQVFGRIGVVRVGPLRLTFATGSAPRLSCASVWPEIALKAA